MQWNDLNMIPEDNKVLLIHVVNDETLEPAMASAKFNIGKGWLLGLGDNFHMLPSNFTVQKWLEIPLP